MADPNRPISSATTKTFSTRDPSEISARNYRFRGREVVEICNSTGNGSDCSQREPIAELGFGLFSKGIAKCKRSRFCKSSEDDSHFNQIPRSKLRGGGEDSLSKNWGFCSRRLQTKAFLYTCLFLTRARHVHFNLVRPKYLVLFTCCPRLKVSDNF